MTFRPDWKNPRLSDPFLWLMAAAFLVAALWKGFELVSTSADERAAERERQELVRDGD